MTAASYSECYFVQGPLFVVFKPVHAAHCMHWSPCLAGGENTCCIWHMWDGQFTVVTQHTVYLDNAGRYSLLPLPRVPYQKLHAYNMREDAHQQMRSSASQVVLKCSSWGHIGPATLH